jgi:ABC-type proline/glycine betaine transport system ATPase subunit
VYILDDPLSAVDAVVGRRLFQACMSGVLKNSIVVLVTHHLQYAQLADAMLVVDKGESLVYGSYEKVMNMINHSDDNEWYSRVKDVLSEMIATEKADDSEVDFVHDIEDLPEYKPVEDTRVASLSDMQEDYSIYTSEEGIHLGDDGNRERWSAVHTSCTSLVPVLHENKPEDSIGFNAFFANTVPLEDKAQGSVSVKTYYRYFKAGGGFIGCFLLLVIFIFAEVSLLS